MRKFALKTDWLIVGVVLTVALSLLGIWLFRGDGGQVKAVISYQGERVKEISLASAGAEVFSLPQVPQVVFRVDGKGNIAFIQSDCPDQVCVHSGNLHRSGDFAACVPNGISVRIVSAESDVDIIIP